MKTSAHWQQVGQKAHHGLCLPLSALRTKSSSGIGEFLDLLPLLPWCRSFGFDTIQLLPLNDSGMDPSPYNLLSSCALNPIYLSLTALQGPKESLFAFSRFNEEIRLAWQEIKAMKLAWLDNYFQQTFSTLSSTPAYLAFLEKHPWLSSYAHCMSLKEHRSADFYRCLQYHCFAQMKQVRDKASSYGIFLMGDLPILPGRESVDLWSNPSLFHQAFSAGAPPDKYNAQGQNWGFPLYNWDAMRKNHFSWWKERLANLSELYHMYRIDHAVGFFRIWAIPEGKLPLEGHFIPENPSLWEPLGKELLSLLIEASPLLPIAEDLGTIPPEVYPILKDFGLCGIKVLRWQGSVPYQDYEPFSMTTVSTPDMEPLALWWQKYPEEAAALQYQKHWAIEPTLSPERHFEILKDAHSTSSFFHINLLQEYFALFPELVSSDPEEERINVPGTLSEKTGRTASVPP